MTVSRAHRAGALAAALLIAAAAAGAQAPRIRVTPHEVAPRVDVTIDGAPFTSYHYPRDQKKPFLFPLRAADGRIVTRGYPLEPRPLERTDHPHHTGVWFNYGDVNGLDFWNNSGAVAPDRAAHMGTVVHRRVIEASSGNDKGELNVEADWVKPGGEPLLKENTRFAFRGDAASRSIDRVTRLSALETLVVLGDNKEGLLGIRVARGLEGPSGLYVSSSGRTGESVWGTRGPWMMLQGTVDDRPVTVAILDHPSNPGHPTAWHARGYGLFAANNLGRKVFDPDAPEAHLVLEPGTSVTFRHRILILDGKAEPPQVQAAYDAFAGAK